MRLAYSAILVASIILYVYALVHEYNTVANFRSELQSETKGLPTDSATFSFATHSQAWARAEAKGALRRERHLRQEFFTIIGISLVAMVCMVGGLRKVLMRAVNHRLNLLSKSMLRPNMAEINFLSIITLLLLYMGLHDPVRRMLFDGVPNSELLMVVLYSLLFLIFVPLLYVILYALLRVHGAKVILVCYAAFFLRFLAEFLHQDSVDLSEMKKIPISGFSPTVQKVLREQRLESKVYQEISKSDSVNAALVGWGPYEHIEIYGNHSKFTDEEFESILLHEIGHSKNYSLLKKFAVLTLIKILEMAIVLHLYMDVAKDYADDSLSLTGAFIILYFLYLILLRKWIMVFHKMTSQLAELDSDLLAKSYHYGRELSKVLFKISVESADYLCSTQLYNMLKSYHPSVFQRIEYLNRQS